MSRDPLIASNIYEYLINGKRKVQGSHSHNRAHTHRIYNYNYYI